MANGNFGGGTGVVDSPYLIEDGYDLAKMQDTSYASSHFRLTKDIDLREYLGTQGNIGWTPVPSFSGVLDGDGYTIYNLFSFNASVVTTGWAFIRNTYGAKIRNLAFKNLWVGSRTNACAFNAGIVAYMNTADCLIENCYVQGKINGQHSMGGIVYSCTFGTIKNCHVDVNMEITINTTANAVNIGAIAGYINNATIKNCYALGTIGAYAFQDKTTVSMTIGTGAGTNTISSVFGIDSGYPLATFVGASSRKTFTELTTAATFSGWETEDYNTGKKLWRFVTGMTPRLVFLDKEEYLFSYGGSYKTYDFILSKFSEYGPLRFSGEELVHTINGTGGTSFTKDFGSSPIYTNVIKVVLTNSATDELITSVALYDENNNNIGNFHSVYSMTFGSAASSYTGSSFDDGTTANEGLYIWLPSVRKINKIVINGDSTKWLRTVNVYAQTYKPGPLLGSTLPTDTDFIKYGVSQDDLEQIPRIKLRDLSLNTSFDLVCNSDKQDVSRSFSSISLSQDSQVSDGAIMKATLDFTTLTNPIRQISIK